MENIDNFDLKDFMPYLLNQAADVSSRGFEPTYKAKYGMLRTEWRVIFHLGRYGQLTAKTICERAQIHKTKVSRAVHALEAKRFLTRTSLESDRRHETLKLTPAGERVFRDLFQQAKQFDTDLMADFSDAEQAQIRRFLVKIAQL